MFKNEFITLTFGDMAENHVGMEKIGKLRRVGDGFQKEDLENIKKLMEDKGIICELVSLTERAKCEFIDESLNAYVLVLKNGINYFLHLCTIKTPTFQNITIINNFLMFFFY